jgi:hypothetical protein
MPPEPCSHCGWPEGPLPDGPYVGRVIATIEDGVEVRELTEHEKRHSDSRPRYCITGQTHWNPPDFFVEIAEVYERKAKLLRAAYVKIAELGKPLT